MLRVHCEHRRRQSTNKQTDSRSAGRACCCCCCMMPAAGLLPSRGLSLLRNMYYPVFVLHTMLSPFVYVFFAVVFLFVVFVFCIDTKAYGK